MIEIKKLFMTKHEQTTSTRTISTKLFVIICNYLIVSAGKWISCISGSRKTWLQVWLQLVKILISTYNSLRDISEMHGKNDVFVNILDIVTANLVGSGREEDTNIP